MFFIRTASERDTESVRALLDRTWHATYDTFYGVEKVTEMVANWHSAKAIKERMQSKGGEFLVADDGKRIAGMAFGEMSKNMSKTALLYQLYVDPAFQRQGIGRDLFAELETCFPDAEIMRLEVEPKNRAAIAFYEGVGFTEVDRIDRMAGVEGMPGIAMEKSLKKL